MKKELGQVKYFLKQGYCIFEFYVIYCIAVWNDIITLPSHYL